MCGLTRGQPIVVSRIIASGFFSSHHFLRDRRPLPSAHRDGEPVRPPGCGHASAPVTASAQILPTQRTPLAVREVPTDRNGHPSFNSVIGQLSEDASTSAGSVGFQLATVTLTAARTAPAKGSFRGAQNLPGSASTSIMRNPALTPPCRGNVGGAAFVLP